MHNFIVEISTWDWLISKFASFLSEWPRFVWLHCKVRKNIQYFELFLVFFIYAKVGKVYSICLIWLRDFENARAAVK